MLNTGFPERIPNKKDDYARLPRLLCALVKFNLGTTDQSKQICHPYDPIDLCTKSLCPFPLQFMYMWIAMGDLRFTIKFTINLQRHEIEADIQSIKTIQLRQVIQPISVSVSRCRVVFTWLSKGIGFGFGFGFTTPFGWLVYLLWFWFYDSQVKTALSVRKS